MEIFDGERVFLNGAAGEKHHLLDAADIRVGAVAG